MDQAGNPIPEPFPIVPFESLPVLFTGTSDDGVDCLGNAEGNVLDIVLVLAVVFVAGLVVVVLVAGDVVGVFSRRCCSGCWCCRCCRCLVLSCVVIAGDVPDVVEIAVSAVDVVEVAGACVCVIVSVDVDVIVCFAVVVSGVVAVVVAVLVA